MVDNRPRYRVPDELRETLLDFTIAYLLERPPNLIDFGIQFFQRLKTERESSAAAGPSSAGRQSQLNGQRQQNEVDDEGRRHGHHTRRQSGKRQSQGEEYSRQRGSMGQGQPGVMRLRPEERGELRQTRTLEDLEGIEEAAGRLVEKTVREAGSRVGEGGTRRGLGRGGGGGVSRRRSV